MLDVIIRFNLIEHSWSHNDHFKRFVNSSNTHLVFFVADEVDEDLDEAGLVPVELGDVNTNEANVKKKHFADSAKEHLR